MTKYDPERDEELFDAILRYISDAQSGSFELLALRLFARQFALNAPYQTYCENLGATPGSVMCWTDIPAVPARAFKLMELSCSAASEVAAVFHSSGTTEGQPGRHYLDGKALKLYEASLRAGFARVAPDGIRLLALMQSPAEAPHSSLSHMLGTLGAKEFFWSEDDRMRLVAILDTVQGSRSPVCVFATAFALLDLFDLTPERRWQLPDGSLVVETGGFKGRTREVSRDELYGLIDERFGVAEPQAFAEYGMSEMASQYYSNAGGWFAGGHWVRARIIDPITDDESESGILRHFDLANWNSVCAIHTQDLAEREQDGRFRLLGRVKEADLRGCSLTMEEQWSRLAAR